MPLRITLTTKPETGHFVLPKILTISKPLLTKKERATPTNIPLIAPIINPVNIPLQTRSPTQNPPIIVPIIGTRLYITIAMVPKKKVKQRPKDNYQKSLLIFLYILLR